MKTAFLKHPQEMSRQLQRAPYSKRGRRSPQYSRTWQESSIQQNLAGELHTAEPGRRALPPGFTVWSSPTRFHCMELSHQVPLYGALPPGSAVWSSPARFCCMELSCQVLLYGALLPGSAVWSSPARFCCIM